jgi:hypothetical protein
MIMEKNGQQINIYQEFLESILNTYNKVGHRGADWFGVGRVLLICLTHICQSHFFTIVHTGNINFTLGHIVVLVDVISQETHLCIVPGILDWDQSGENFN